MEATHDTLTLGIDVDTTRLQASLQNADRLGAKFARTLTSAFEDVAVRGRKLDDVVKSVALNLSQMALKAALKPLEQSFSSGFGNILSGFAGFANGGVPGKQMPVPFANGGVVSAPTAFRFGSGQLGLMGERGTEAILPLARGADGRLGVRSGVAGAATQIAFNVTANDAESFQRSEAQIGAMLSRVISRGERNL